MTHLDQRCSRTISKEVKALWSFHWLTPQLKTWPRPLTGKNVYRNFFFLFATKHLERVYLGFFFSGLTVLSFSSKSLKYTPVIVSFFGRMFNTFCLPKYYGPHRTSRWLRLGLLWPLGPGPFPMTTLKLTLSFIHLIINQSLNHSYQAQKNHSLA